MAFQSLFMSTTVHLFSAAASSVVLPTGLWPTSATLRRLGAESGFMTPDYIEGPPQARLKTTHKKTAAAAKTTAARSRAADTALPLERRPSGSRASGSVMPAVFPATMEIP